MPDENIENKQDETNSDLDALLKVADPQEEELVGIKSKFENDINKIASGYKGILSEHTKLKNSTIVPEEYKFPKDVELPDDVKSKVVASAKELGFNQVQFDKTVKKLAEKTREIDSKRQEVLGSEEDVEKLRAFYKDLPAGTLDKILKSGDLETIKEMKRHREKMIKDIKIENPGVGNMAIGEETVNDLAKDEKALRDFWRSRNKPGSNAFDIKEIDSNIINLARKIAAAKKKIHDSRPESLEYY